MMIGIRGFGEGCCVLCGFWVVWRVFFFLLTPWAHAVRCAVRFICAGWKLEYCCLVLIGVVFMGMVWCGGGILFGFFVVMVLVLVLILC